MKRILVSLMCAMAVVFGTSAPTPVFAAGSPTDAAKQQVCQGVNSQSGGSCGSGGAEIKKVVKAVLTILSLIAGVVAVIMVIIAGLKYTTSGGESSKTASAKNALIYAIVGLVVVASAQFIVRFVLTNAK